MPQTASCPNCLGVKTNWEAYYCDACSQALQVVEDAAENQKLPMFEYRALKEQALAGRRGRGNMDAKHRPDTPFSRIDDTEFRARMGLDK